MYSLNTFFWANSVFANMCFEGGCVEAWKIGREYNSNHFFSFFLYGMFYVYKDNLGSHFNSQKLRFNIYPYSPACTCAHTHKQSRILISFPTSSPISLIYPLAVLVTQKAPNGPYIQCLYIFFLLEDCLEYPGSAHLPGKLFLMFQALSQAFSPHWSSLTPQVSAWSPLF